MPDDALMPWLPVPAQVVEEVGDDVQVAGLGYLVVHVLPTARSSTPRPNGENTTVRSGGTLPPGRSGRRRACRGGSRGCR